MRRLLLVPLLALAAVTATVFASLAPAASASAAQAASAAPAAVTASVALPNSMASTGDSITRSFNATTSGCFLSDCPQYSWSTGTSTVTSHYQRILAANPQISGNVFNDAKTGAKMAALDAQMKTAASQGAQYVTVMMGANDVCTSSRATMTPTATLQSQFQTALGNFFAARPNSQVFVSSIPNIYQLWAVLHTNSSARNAWSSFGICQSMLSSSNTEADRQAVLTQEKNDNAALASVCAQYVNCKWDNLATFNYQFTASDVSRIDYFHPSVSGQSRLAGTTWSAGFWPGV
ncbi:MAG TPA: GDSL-type esterase/lipase family protein [Jatrophihabitans sp.]|jgi:lysophospholipase L1-like esterase|uniref:GDSL-type esterase/lipase family protein n=1 Tax=Jatrophihabitans sp. TaxID=1932789 RepID=UPI002F1AE8D1